MNADFINVQEKGNAKANKRMYQGKGLTQWVLSVGSGMD